MSYGEFKVKCPHCDFVRWGRLSDVVERSMREHVERKHKEASKHGC